MEKRVSTYSMTENIVFGAQVGLYMARTAVQYVREKLDCRRASLAACGLAGTLALSCVAVQIDGHEADGSVAVESAESFGVPEPVEGVDAYVGSVHVPEIPAEIILPSHTNDTPESTLREAIAPYYGSEELQEFGKEYVPANIELAYEIARRAFPDFYTSEQMGALVTLWEHESRWDHMVVNKQSGAFGIAQSNPRSGAKMPKRNAPASQIRWGLNYISERYGTPVAALTHWQEFGWY